MMAELLIAGRGLSEVLHHHGGSRDNYRNTTSPGDVAVGGSFLASGLAGSVGRQIQREAVNAATGFSENASIGNTLYQSSLQKGGDFANHVISNIAKGNYGQVGSIKGEDGVNAYLSYMGLQNSENTASPTENSMSSTPTPSYSNIEIGGGCITGTESVDGTSRNFAMYHAGQYMPPSHGDYEMVQSVDGANWYKQYAQDAVERRPYETENEKIAYHESIVQSFHQYCNEKSGYKGV